GDTGPCGPCSEIHIDRGEEFGCDSPDCAVGCDCDRYLEIWNLVFMQFNRTPSGTLSPLPSKNVDTGMGLERVSTVLEGVSDDYKTGLFIPLYQWLREISPVKKGEEKAFRIISDHLRALTFLLGEGILPSNTGRGYVVRRVLRRAFRYGRKLALREPFLYQGVPVVARTMKENYPELSKNSEEIAKIIRNKEESFKGTLVRGIGILEDITEELKKKKVSVISSQEAFKLYDTYGLPLDLTEEVLKEENLGIDREEVDSLLVKHKKKAREEFLQKRKTVEVERGVIYDTVPSTKFKGYTSLNLETSLVGIIKKEILVDEIQEGEEGGFVLTSTPFYPEGGGQVGDRGEIFTREAQAEVLDTQEIKDKVIIHQVKIKKGRFKKGDEVIACVDKERRKKICRSHSATHLLQASLREVLGKGVRQSGSLVEEEKLRFDFTHSSPLTKNELKRVSSLINEKIRQDLPVLTEEVSLSEAQEKGAIALFEERYKEKVRSVDIGGFSREVCGGTHLTRSGEIGIVKIISETGIAAGIRRIEALVGEKAFLWMDEKNELLGKVASKLKTSDENVLPKIEEIHRRLTKMEEKLKESQKEIIEGKIEELIGKAILIDKVKVVSGKWEDISPEVLRGAAEKIRDKLKDAVVVLASISPNKAFLVATSTSKEIPANKVIEKVCLLAKGSGGGRWDFAQGGTSHLDKVEEALSQVRRIVEEILK
ncbi:alanine--tRNA ligase, partial [Patescibacteria group bacterium]|nr:alanine--tRNA ligase [Patescibacteria group bacterium]